MKRAFLSLAIAALALPSALAFAEPVLYKIDASHSSVGFSIRHFFSKVPGRFDAYSGTIMIDDQNLEKSSVDVTIEAKSINTNQAKRDEHLRTDDFFAVEKNPNITFKSTKISPGEGDSFKVEGDLTIRGVTKPVVLNATKLGTGQVAVEGRPPSMRAGFEATTTVNRKDFGILWNKSLDQGGTLLGDDVTINLEIAAVKDEPKPADAKPADAKPEAKQEAKKKSS